MLFFSHYYKLINIQSTKPSSIYKFVELWICYSFCRYIPWIEQEGAGSNSQFHQKTQRLALANLHFSLLCQYNKCIIHSGKKDKLLKEYYNEEQLTTYIWKSTYLHWKKPILCIFQKNQSFWKLHILKTMFFFHQPADLFSSFSQLGNEEEHLFSNNHICILHSKTYCMW